MSRSGRRDLREVAAIGYHCDCCGEVYTLVQVAPGDFEIPTEVGCPNCGHDLELVEVVNVCGSPMWKPLRSGRASGRLLSGRGSPLSKRTPQP